MSKRHPLEDLLTLRYVLQVRELQAIGRVADKVGIKVSSVSRRLRDLEDELGLSLFERHSSGVRPTAAGNVVMDGMQLALDQLDRTFADAIAGGRGEIGMLKLGYVWPIATGPASEILVAQTKTAPRVEIQLVEGGGDKLVTDLLERRLDLGFLIGDLFPNNLEHWPLWSERLYFAVAAEAPEIPPGWSVLEAQPLLAMEMEGWACFQRMAFLDDGPKFDVHPQACSRDGVLSLVATGAGVAIMPESATQMSAPGVRFSPIEAGHAHCRVVAVWSDRNPNHALRAFVSMLKRRFPAS